MGENGFPQNASCIQRKTGLCKRFHSKGSNRHADLSRAASGPWFECCVVRGVGPLGELRDLPEGFIYQPRFLAPSEQRQLLDEIEPLAFHDVRMHGVVARRRVIQYGWKYAFDGARLSEGPPLPPFLLPVRSRAAQLAEVPADALSEALLTEYQPGAPIGWHRDAPGFGIVVGISLLSACRFRFRRGPDRGSDRVTLTLDPGSAYVLAGPSRTEWQHSIPEVDTLRYSITFRTLRKR